MDLSVIIVNWNTCELLSGCLDSIFRETRNLSLEIIVIDNDSSDDSVDMLKKKFPQVFIIENKENRGFAAANNQGIRAAKSDYILFLNPDTVILDNAISKSLDFISAHPKTAMVGCRILDSAGRLEQFDLTPPSLANMLAEMVCLNKLYDHIRLFCMERLCLKHRYASCKVKYIVGCFMMVRAEAIRQIGDMDERFFMYFEEADWCERFRRAGWEIDVISHVSIVHSRSGSTKQVFGKMRRELVRSELLFMYKRGIASGFLARFIRGAFLLTRIPYWLTVSILPGKQKDKAKKILSAYLSALCILFTNRDTLANGKK